MKKIFLLTTVSLILISFVEAQESTLTNFRKISATQGGFTGELDADDLFGISTSVIGDLDGDGNEDLAVGAPNDDDGGTELGAVWILFLNEDRSIKSYQKISTTQGLFEGILKTNDRFGKAISPLGDIDKDGIIDIAVGAYGDDDGGNNTGAIWILFLNTDGTVKSHQKISSTNGNLTGLTSNTQFGYSVTFLNDMDGDGNIELAVGAPTYDDDGGTYRGSVWILFLNQDGTVKKQQIINDFQGGFTGILDNQDRFGICVSNIGDINGDNIDDIAVHSGQDDDGASNAGAFYILTLNPNGTVSNTQKISATSGGFSGVLEEEGRFGAAIANVGDIDADGINDILTCSFFSYDGESDKGKLWLLYMNNDATVKGYEEFSSLYQPLQSFLDDGDEFGRSLTVFSSINALGKKEIVIGAFKDDDGYEDAGAVYIIDLDVKYKPVAVANEDQNLCNGNQYLIDGSGSSVFDNDELTYLWTCENYEITDPALAQFTFLAPEVETLTQYEFVLQVECQGILSNPDTVIISVYPKPQTPIIVREQFTLSTDEALMYQWYLNDNEITGATTRTIVIEQDGNYQVQVISENGCPSEISDIFYAKVVPEANASAPEQVCAGTLITLSGSESVSPSDGDLLYNWTSPDIELQNANQEIVIFNAPAVDATTTYSFYLQVKLNEIYSDPDTVQVTILQSPQKPTVTQNYNTLTASEAFEYQWYFNGDEILRSNRQVLAFDQNGEYQVLVTNEAGCKSELSDIANFVLVPTAQAFAVSQVCSGTLLSLFGSDSSSPGGGDLEYSWSSNEIVVPDADQEITSFIVPGVKTSTTYTFSLTVSQDGVSSEPDEINVIIRPAPEKPTIEQFADTLRASSATDYQWFLEGTEIDDGNNQILFVEQSGNYYVKVANDYGCVSDPSTELYVTKTWVNNIPYDILVYPNPASENVTISGLPPGVKIPLKLFDINGKLLFQTNSFYGEANFELSTLERGIYIIEINKITSVKIVKN